MSMKMSRNFSLNLFSILKAPFEDIVTVKHPFVRKTIDNIYLENVKKLDSKSIPNLVGDFHLII